MVFKVIINCPPKQVHSSVLQLTGQASVGKKYKVSHSPADQASVTNSYLTGIPCGTCPVMALCSENGVISPRNCEYYNQWLKYAVEYEQVDDEMTDLHAKMSW